MYNNVVVAFLFVVVSSSDGGMTGHEVGIRFDKHFNSFSSVFNLSLFSCSSLATTTTRVYISPKCTPHLNSQVSVISTGVERKAIFPSSIFESAVPISLSSSCPDSWPSYSSHYGDRPEQPVPGDPQELLAETN